MEHSYVFHSMDTLMNIWWIVVFYLNAYVFMPRFLYHRKYSLYAGLLLATLVAVSMWDRSLFFLFGMRLAFSLRMLIRHNLLPYGFTVMVSIAYRAITDRTRTETLIREQESEHLKTELSFLRSQISPHFLFNVLNNMAAMARLKSAELEPTIQKLASLMRYMLYETDEDKVSISSELEYLNDYIDLQQQRFGSELILEVDFQVQEPWQALEPMLLIPFVENAFKHGAVLSGHPEIHIHLRVHDDALTFSVQNRFDVCSGSKDKTSGIGLANIRRRLELLYPNRHRLDLLESQGWFTATLQLQFASV